MNRSIFPAILLPLTALANSNNAVELNEKITFSGAIEVEASYTDSNEYGDDKSNSDLILATAAFNIDAVIIENVSIHLGTLYKEDGVDYELHQGYLQLDDFANTEGLSLTLGKAYVPFGKLSTSVVGDPLGMELVSPDESWGVRHSTAILSWNVNNITIGGYIFNSSEDGDDELTDFGFRIGFDNEHVSGNFDYLSDVSDSAIIQDVIDVNFNGEELAAYSLNTQAKLGNTALLFEHIQLDDLNEIGGKDIAPSVSLIDIAFDIRNAWEVSLTYQRSDDAAGILPESRLSAGVSTHIYRDNIFFGVVFWHDQDYDLNDGGSDEDLNGVTFQVATEF